MPKLLSEARDLGLRVTVGSIAIAKEILQTRLRSNQNSKIVSTKGRMKGNIAFIAFLASTGYGSTD